MVEEHYRAFIERVVTPERLAHSLGVMQVIGELAEVYSLDRDKAMTIGLLHDAAKDFTPTEQAAIMAEAKIQINDPSEADYTHHLHGPVGAYFVRRELGISDPLILDAIASHTFYWRTPTFDDPICWCLRFSDILEPGRNWGAVRWLKTGGFRLRETVYAGHWQEGAFLHMGALLHWFAEDGMPIHPNIRRIHHDLSAQLKLDGKYLESAMLGAGTEL